MVHSKVDMRRTAELRRRQSGVKSDLGPVLATLVARSRRIACYLPFGTEPHIDVQPGWLLPVLLPDGDLDWTPNTGRYAENPHGLREAVGDRLGVLAVAECDLVIVPALLVDRQGYRLGRGGGSYDRALRRATGLTVALLHDGELVDELPHEDHDVPVAAVATPSQGLLRLPTP